MRPTTIYAAILAEHGNADESYPRPLTCYVCGERPGKMYRIPTCGDPSCACHHSNEWRYVTEADPLPAGWQEITSEDYKHKMVYCGPCYADRAEGREISYDY